MARSRWLFSDSTKNMVVKIVHPGGHIELHDRPVLAAEIMLRNPKCCVAYPHVFQQPWAIVAPDTNLMPGQKFYVVPINTVRKLQRLSLKYSPSAAPIDSFSNSRQTPENAVAEHETETMCWFFQKKGTYSCMKQSDNETWERSNGSRSSARSQRGTDGDECFPKDKCFIGLIPGLRAKTNSSDCTEESRSMESYQGTSETRLLIRHNRLRRGMRGSPRARMSLDHWQPSLGSINEE